MKPFLLCVLTSWSLVIFGNNFATVVAGFGNQSRCEEAATAFHNSSQFPVATSCIEVR
jgi:hypothetical protein